MTGGVDPAARTTHPRRRARRAAVAWSLVVVVASLVDPGTLLEAGGVSPAVGSSGGVGTAVFTVAHLVAYGVLAWLLVGGFGSGVRDPRAVGAAVAVAVAAGVGVELLQVPVAARTGSAADALVNAVGAAVGAGVRAALVGRSR